MAVQWTVRVCSANGDKFSMVVFALTREEAKDEGLRVGVQFTRCNCTVEHIACSGAHPKPFAKTARGKQRREERRFRGRQTA